ncbi:MAG: alkylphosphonate utilization protein [Bacteroidetes bacterium]|jgi:protein PhnA|nr:alkylphosphonate utilization protein [Bacteroidota bacterium]MBP6403737.1 alkylphosphonate utilization protein [Bacteroidia bacterium]MBK6840619.1 alkylphosphonate utilization protein [Bacteroidota bacterium]MBK9541589.1 alkylphosphonate utilization protein [Bacteroidota bacterium]MBL0258537.1 alkylphosphonate utilization protein [Bacteroidota bacterium]
MVVKDSIGNNLVNGDTVILTRSLKPKGSNITLKQGTTIRNIILRENIEEIDCKVNGSSIVLRTEFLKKA